MITKKFIFIYFYYVKESAARKLLQTSKAEIIVSWK